VEVFSITLHEYWAKVHAIITRNIQCNFMDEQAGPYSSIKFSEIAGENKTRLKYIFWRRPAGLSGFLNGFFTFFSNASPIKTPGAYFGGRAFHLNEFQSM